MSEGSNQPVFLSLIITGVHSVLLFLLLLPLPVGGPQDRWAQGYGSQKALLRSLCLEAVGTNTALRLSRLSFAVLPASLQLPKVLIHSV